MIAWGLIVTTAIIALLPWVFWHKGLAEGIWLGIMAVCGIVFIVRRAADPDCAVRTTAFSVCPNLGPHRKALGRLHLPDVRHGRPVSVGRRAVEW